ncbi:MAG: hypothetical protein COW54_07365 [Rhodobacteraceae bacterium CG17_big_fil_post_rev_8_21_14_2_50_63_15]|nr:MAG: hypothetical protein COW54_07365 [Rhodobacteraceae bacterium CG17_big_fil_post_rev_8_21_14_2_50_63_15]
MARLKNDVPVIVSLIRGHSDKNEMAFRSNDGVLFGWFIQTNKPIDMIRNAIEGSLAWQSADSIMIFEVSKGLSGKGFTRQWAWLQHTATED